MMKPRLLALALTLTLTSLGVASTAQADKFDDAARQLLQRYPLVDGHVDVPHRLHEKWEDVTKATAGGDFDYPRARAGGLTAPFMSIYTPASSEAAGATALAHALIDQVEAIAYRAPDKFAIARTAAEVRQHFAAGKISLLLGMENGAPIAGELGNLQAFHARGVRYITLAHSKSNHISDSSYDKVRIWKGLSPFGKQVVAEMNRLGIMVDVSHLSDDAFYEVLKLSKVPVIASHSSLRHFTPGLERNVSDDMLKALAKNGGVLMINFGSFFLTDAARQYSEQRDAAEEAFKKLHGDTPSAEALAQFEKAYAERHPYPFASVADVANHIDRAVKLVGIDYVGLGSDYDGVGDSLPTGLKDASQYPNLIAELLRRGYKEADIGKIMSGNVLRVMERVEQFAATGK
ncbi:MAG TPA: dipeptidase [Permianibacter sp.]|nr:dipeptidase [Permianibacter sp.]